MRSQVAPEKRIVINSGSFLGGNNPSGSGGRDIGMDQPLPTTYYGTDFVLAEGSGTGDPDIFERPVIIADTDGTLVFVNGSTTAEATTLNSGDFLSISGDEYSTDGTMSIRTSKPTYVYQNTNSNTSSNGQGTQRDPPRYFPT